MADRSKVGGFRPAPLTSRQSAVLGKLMAFIPTTPQHVGARLGISTGSATRTLESLRRRGLASVTTVNGVRGYVGLYLGVRRRSGRRSS